jgi:adenosylmethionine-8-amino-7-oxononanoate aminotransferase
MILIRERRVGSARFWTGEGGTVPDPVFVTAEETSVFPRELDRALPLIERGCGAWLYDVGGNPILDAVSGGAMVTSLGHGVEEIIKAYDQARRISFLYNQQFTTPPQEELAKRLMEKAPSGFTRVHFTSGGAEANETALRLLRAHHVEGGMWCWSGKYGSNGW